MDVAVVGDVPVDAAMNEWGHANVSTPTSAYRGHNRVLRDRVLSIDFTPRKIHIQAMPLKFNDSPA